MPSILRNDRSCTIGITKRRFHSELHVLDPKLHLGDSTHESHHGADSHRRSRSEHNLHAAARSIDRRHASVYSLPHDILELDRFLDPFPAHVWIPGVQLRTRHLLYGFLWPDPNARSRIAGVLFKAIVMLNSQVLLTIVYTLYLYGFGSVGESGQRFYVLLLPIIKIMA